MIHITRQKRPDRVICKWGNIIRGEKYVVELYDPEVFLMNDFSTEDTCVSFPKSEIPNLIKALLEIQKETK